MYLFFSFLISFWSDSEWTITHFFLIYFHWTGDNSIWINYINWELCGLRAHDVNFDVSEQRISNRNLKHFDFPSFVWDICQWITSRSISKLILFFFFLFCLNANRTVRSKKRREKNCMCKLLSWCAICGIMYLFIFVCKLRKKGVQTEWKNELSNDYDETEPSIARDLKKTAHFVYFTENHTFLPNNMQICVVRLFHTVCSISFACDGWFLTVDKIIKVCVCLHTNTFRMCCHTP